MRSDPTTIKETTRRLVRHQPKKPTIAVPRRESLALTPRQKRMLKPEHFRDLSNAVRHLTYHVCPFSNSREAWQWNLDQLRQRWNLFNGLKVLGINYDQDTVTPDDFMSYCESIGLHWDHVVIRDNCRRLGEVKTWIPSLELLSPETAEENEVVFSAHAKGVKYGEVMPPLIRDWSRVMYEVNLDDWDRVRKSLEWFISTGAFRARYGRSKSCRSGVYYSGAFWWWRLHDIGQRDWRVCGQWYAGRELWIGNQVRDKSESDCLFLDGSRSPYLRQYWNSVIRPRYKKFVEQESINAQ